METRIDVNQFASHRRVYTTRAQLKKNKQYHPITNVEFTILTVILEFYTKPHFGRFPSHFCLKLQIFPPEIALLQQSR